jgi:ElaB/YqjD/DUF883 family membrane-anchored ribosome-binding protein
MIDIEETLKLEYGVVKGQIAAHVYASLGIAFAAGVLVGLLFF